MFLLVPLLYIQISESFIQSLERLIILFFECYPNLEGSSRAHSHTALLNIIMGVAGASRATLKTFLAHIGKDVGCKWN